LVLFLPPLAFPGITFNRRPNPVSPPPELFVSFTGILMPSRYACQSDSQRIIFPVRSDLILQCSPQPGALVENGPLAWSFSPPLTSSAVGSHKRMVFPFSFMSPRSNELVPDDSTRSLFRDAGDLSFTVLTVSTSSSLSFLPPRSQE